MSGRVGRFLAGAALSVAMLVPIAASAETIQGAMAKAYRNNSELNATRAGVRATDENVAIAKSGFRPSIGAVGTIDYSKQNGISSATGQFGITLEQPIFDGFRTRNSVRSAEASVRASNEDLRNTGQNILLTAASSYMDVIRDRQIAALTERNLAFLTEQVRAARSRFEVGEGTRTDVAQAEASQALAIAQASSARAQAAVSASVYRQVIGDDPGRLSGASPVRKALPGNIDLALTIALTEHPAIRAALHDVDAAAFQVKVAEGGMLPQVTADVGVQTSFRETYAGLPGVRANDGTSNSASIGATLSIPIYQGGRVSAQVRQAKELLGQARIAVDISRDQVRQALTAAWTRFIASAESVDARRQVVSASQLALNGVIEERNVGQRTTLDVLNAQADVIEAQVALAQDERELVVASYAILSAAGRLSPARLSLAVEEYRPEEHYNAVKDKWYGTKTPDGR